MVYSSSSDEIFYCHCNSNGSESIISDLISSNRNIESLQFNNNAEPVIAAINMFSLNMFKNGLDIT